MYKLTQQPIAKKITTKEASQFLDLNNFPGQRALSESKAKRYSELHTQGKLRPVDIAFATCPDGNRYLVNGQHVCQACIWSNKDMNAVITHWRCETWADAWQLFATFDVHACRTQVQVFKAARGLFSAADLRDVPLRVLSSCGSALLALEGGVVSFDKLKTADKETKPRLVDLYASEAIWVSTFSECGHMINVGCVAAMLGTYRKHQEEAMEFWRKVADGLGYSSQTEPAKKVHDLLVRPYKEIASGNGRERQKFIFSSCVLWWNSHITGEPRKIVKFAAMSELPAIK